MELNEILDTIVSYNIAKPWEIMIYQYVFYALRCCSLEQVLEPQDPWDSLYELCEIYGDPNFKKYIHDFFDEDNFNQVEDKELLEIFCKKFLLSLNDVIKSVSYENDFITFLDVTIFEYFTKLLGHSEYHIFPKTIDDTLNEEVFRIFREKELAFRKEEENYEVIHEPIEVNKDYYKKMSMAHAIRKKKIGFAKTKRLSKTSLTHTRKMRVSIAKHDRTHEKV
jgi:uncharacterized protein YozE (UPF0346 family)